jgi:hypothetical protein
MLNNYRELVFHLSASWRKVGRDRGEARKVNVLNIGARLYFSPSTGGGRGEAGKINRLNISARLYFSSPPAGGRPGGVSIAQ